MVDSSSAQRAGLKDTLKDLRDNPIDATGEQNGLLISLLQVLLKTGPDVEGRFHWFCSAADDITRELAIFLFRVFAYDNQMAVDWRARLSECLHGCCSCILGFSQAKFHSRATYFGAFKDDVIHGFWEAFELWEVSEIVKALSHDDTGNKHPSSIADCPLPLVYHMVSTLRALQEPFICNLITQNPPSGFLASWPDGPPAPGLLLLLLNESPGVRRWAGQQLKQSKSIEEEYFIEPYETVIGIFASILSRTDSDIQERYPIAERNMKSLGALVSTSSSVAWRGFTIVVHLLPISVLSMPKSSTVAVDIRKIIFGHLHDNAEHFPQVLRCLVELAKRLNSKLWEGEKADYASIVFDAVKDNPSFSDMLSEWTTADVPWFLSWFSAYLQTIWASPIFDEVLAKMMGFLCGEAQHERFKAKRAIAMVAATKLLQSLSSKMEGDNETKPYKALHNVLDVHCDILLAVGMSREYGSSEWHLARQSALELLHLLLIADVNEVSRAILDLANALPPSSGQLRLSLRPLRQRLWSRMYETFQANDSTVVAIMLEVAASCAHMDELNVSAFSSNRLKKKLNEETSNAYNVVFQNINHALQVFRNGFLDAVVKFANYNTSDTILDLFSTHSVPDILALLLSPVSDFHVAAQTLVGQAFDVDGRLECFRALFSNQPGHSFQGLLVTIERFNQFTPQIPEACGMSKALVRCMTDVIEVLCSTPDGLLLNERYILGTIGGTNSIAEEVPRLWRMMSSSITVIFKRTPAWAEFHENTDMVEWMRDALIFGRDMLAQRRIFEAAALVASGKANTVATPRKLSNIGRSMVNDLQSVLLELTRWLRLTDEELLHQSFALLQSLLDCFRQTSIPPNPSAVAKLTKFIDDGRSTTRATQSTRLDAARLSKLEDSLASFDEDDDDDVQIISHNVNVDHPKAAKTVASSAVNARRQNSPKATSITASRKKMLAPAPRQEVPNAPGPSRYFQTIQHKSKGPANIRKPMIVPSKMKSSAPVLTSKAAVDKTSVIPTIAQKPASSSSDSEDEDNEEEGKRGLASLGRFQRSPKKISKPTERRQVKILEVPSKVQNARDERIRMREDAHRMAMRLKPDLSSLHRVILSWNYEHNGPVPESTEVMKLRSVPDRFRDYQEYFQTFEPLLRLECWQQIVQSKEEPVTYFNCEISSRQFVDDWLDMDGFIREKVDKDWRLAETDIVLLRSQTDATKHTMAKITSFRPWLSGIQVGLRAYLASPSGDVGLQIGSKWRIGKVFSLSTLHREYAALMALPYIDLFDTVIQPKLLIGSVPDSQAISNAMKSHRVNEPQARAILNVMNTDGFSLIQGPPGTGKTWTICSLVGAFLSRRPKAAALIHPGRQTTMPNKEPVKKLLICAPSNAAIDEVAKRLMEGVRDSTGSLVVPRVVRIGTESSMNISVKDISLDTLVDEKLNPMRQMDKSKDLPGELQNLRTEIESVKSLKQQKQADLAQLLDNGSGALQLEIEIRALNSKRMTLSQKLDQLKDKQKSNFRSLDAARRSFRYQIVSQADVVCSTLTGSGHDVLENQEFEMVVIDEAAQSIELSSLIPLKYRCTRCVMVGDPKQLPPTVLSKEACKWGYDQSLFVRLQKHQPEAVHLLSIQYRMHPHISLVPSRVFYDGRLHDGPELAEKTRQPWHSAPNFGVYKFYNVQGGRETNASVGHSIFNRAECQVALALYDRLIKQFPAHQFDFKIGIVSMYRAQVFELRRAFERRYGPDILGKVDFNSVDGFQGQEKDIIILSCVRAGPSLDTVGFLADERRMNVAITRARCSLFILGHAPTLERSNARWKQIIEDARSRSCLQNVDVAYFQGQLGSSKSFADESPSTSPSKLITTRKRKDLDEVTPVPAGLMKPKDFRSTSKRARQDNKEAGDTPNIDDLNSQKQAMAAEDTDSRPVPSRTQSGEETRPLPPRRPQVPANMFIRRPPMKPGQAAK